MASSGYLAFSDDTLEYLFFYKTSKVDVKRALKADRDIYGKWFKFVQEKFDEHNGGVVPHASRVS